MPSPTYVSDRYEKSHWDFSFRFLSFFSPATCTSWRIECISFCPNVPGPFFCLTYKFPGAPRGTRSAHLGSRCGPAGGRCATVRWRSPPTQPPLGKRCCMAPAPPAASAGFPKNIIKVTMAREEEKTIADILSPKAPLCSSSSAFRPSRCRQRCPTFRLRRRWGSATLAASRHP